MSKPGDRCAACGGRLIVRSSVAVGANQVRYLNCNKCGASGGKWLIPIEFVSSRVVTTKGKIEHT